MTDQSQELIFQIDGLLEQLSEVDPRVAELVSSGLDQLPGTPITVDVQEIFGSIQAQKLAEQTLDPQDYQELLQMTDQIQPETAENVANLAAQAEVAKGGFDLDFLDIIPDLDLGDMAATAAAIASVPVVLGMGAMVLAPGLVAAGGGYLVWRFQHNARRAVEDMRQRRKWQQRSQPSQAPAPVPVSAPAPTPVTHDRPVEPLDLSEVPQTFNEMDDIWKDINEICDYHGI